MNRISMYKRDEWRFNRTWLKQERFGHRRTRIGGHVLTVTWIGRVVWTRVRNAR